MTHELNIITEKLRTLRRFAEKYGITSEMVCVHGIDADIDRTPLVTFYNREKCGERFGVNGWIRIRGNPFSPSDCNLPRWYNWEKRVDGVNVSIFQAEFIAEDAPVDPETIPVLEEMFATGVEA